MTGEYYVFPGSFNPLHQGHLDLINFVESKYNCTVFPEICAKPFDKPSLTQDDVNTRVEQFELLGRVVVVTNRPSFISKAILLQEKFKKDFEQLNLYFVVGHDTVARLNDSKYCFNSKSERDSIVRRLFQMNVKFLVFPRNGKLTEGIDRDLADICIFHTEYKGSDISSSELRNSSDEYKYYKYAKELELNQLCYYRNDIRKVAAICPITGVVTLQYGEEFLPITHYTTVRVKAEK